MSIHCIARAARRGLAVCLAVAACAAAVPGAEPIVCEVSSAHAVPAGAPVEVLLPEGTPPAASLSLIAAEKPPIVLQRFSEDESRACFLLDEPLAAGESRRYVLRAPHALPPDGVPAVRVEQDDARLRVLLHDKPLLQYNIAPVTPPAGIESFYTRSGHIHPVWSPSGRVVTAEFPADHPHQHGIFFAWVNTSFEGRPVDFWNQHQHTGNVEHVSLASGASGDAFAEFTARLRHLDLTAPGGLKAALNETWTVRCYNTTTLRGPADGEHHDAPAPTVFLFDLESRQSCAGESPLLIHHYHYGGQAYRGPGDWIGQPEHKLTTSEGQDRISGNQTHPRWVCAEGLVEGRLCSAALLGHPDNFRFPCAVRLHPSKPYFCFAPCSDGEFEIKPGEPLTTRTRFVVHDGPPAPDFYNALWQNYAEPVTLRVR